MGGRRVEPARRARDGAGGRAVAGTRPRPAAPQGEAAGMARPGRSRRRGGGGRGRWTVAPQGEAAGPARQEPAGGAVDGRSRAKTVRLIAGQAHGLLSTGQAHGFLRTGQAHGLLRTGQAHGFLVLVKHTDSSVLVKSTDSSVLVKHMGAHQAERKLTSMLTTLLSYV